VVAVGKGGIIASENERVVGIILWVNRGFEAVS
jgi:hypothetical protein